MDNLTIDSYPDELKIGIKNIIQAYPEKFSNPKYKLKFERAEDSGFSIVHEDKFITIKYNKPIHAFRSLGILLGKAENINISQKLQFDSISLMLDASRNGVYKVETLKSLFISASLMGIDSCMLYIEDVYAIPNEPFFGYMRGAYSYAEFEELDDFAYSLGIELYPAIQTLGHLEQILQWPEYASYKDTDSIILADNDKTYKLLKKMIATVQKPFRSKKINLGMDEAVGLGQGAYKNLFGDKNPFEIMNSHLTKVRDICNALGLQPRIWSDMYFRLGSKTHAYYDKDWTVPQNIAGKIPKDVSLVYWDYYHLDKEFYVDWIKKHRQLGSNPQVALGSWSWNRFWAELGFASKAIIAGMQACRESHIKEVILTNWGDDGMEVDIRSAMPAWQLFAEYAYAENADDEHLIIDFAKNNFWGTMNADYTTWIKAADIDRLPNAKELHANPSKVLLYEDVLLGLWASQYDQEILESHYASVAKQLANKDDRLDFPAQIAHVLSIKTGLRKRLVNAYNNNDVADIKVIATELIPKLVIDVTRLWKLHRNLWLKLYKPFGLEVIEMRYGFVITRLTSLVDRLDDYMSGRIESIQELEMETRQIYPKTYDEAPEIQTFRRIASSSKIV